MITEDKVKELFCMVDDFCKFFDAMIEKYTLVSCLQGSDRWGSYTVLYCYSVCTLPELGRADGIDTIAYRDDGIKVVKQRVSCNLSFTFGLNYRDFLGS